MHSAMHHLFGTWSTVFPLPLLQKIESDLQFSSSENCQSLGLPPLRASESLHPAHDRHINPKYLEVRRQFGHEITDSVNYVGRNFVHGHSKNHVRHPAAVRFNNGVDIDRTRALIDAYGIDKRSETIKYPNDEEPTQNGIPTMTWKNSEEEEFDWENMIPTLADHGRKDVFSSSLPSSGSFRNAEPSASHLRQDWPNQPQLPEVNGSSIVDVPYSTAGLKNTVYGILNGPTHLQSSSDPQVYWKLAQNVNHSSTHQFSATKGGNNPRMPLGGSGILPPPVKPSSTGYSPEFITQNQGQPFGSRRGSVSLEYVKLEQLIAHEPASSGAWPPRHLHSSHAGPMSHTYQSNRQIRGQLDTLSGKKLLVNQDVHSSSISDHNLGSTGSILQNPMLPSGQQFRPIPFNQSLVHTEMLPPHSLPQDMRHHLAPPASVVGSSPLSMSQLQRGYAPGHMASVGTIDNNSFMQSPMSTRLHGLPLPLPRGLPGASYTSPISQPSCGAPNPPVGGDYSNLFSSLVAQGVISLNQNPSKEDPVGLEFNPDLLKVHHSSAITALYLDLPRQCTTCGLRFKLQEAHSRHMDWHVTKNRVTRNRKQKPSRKWFVSVNMWLTGAEALRTNSIPDFLPSENIVEKKDDEELAVPADDDQKYCALCGEPFDDFYCDETDEWMYKGAVYTNAPNGSTSCMDNSQLGHIVHAKCRSETGIVSDDMKKCDLVSCF
ncbi:hypothetical protein Leryth_018033 [Lithospermum erythrorhizon]|nr:hypothetical protein Leryth_018033 [Lithospermum erythrorhizon]